MNRSKQNLAINQIGKYFIQHGKMLTQQEYTALPVQPVAGFMIKRLFKTYDNMISEFKKSSYWAELSKPAPKKVAPKPKPAPQAAVKPAVKPAVKKEAK